MHHAAGEALRLLRLLGLIEIEIPFRRHAIAHKSAFSGVQPHRFLECQRTACNQMNIINGALFSVFSDPLF